jgi:predicted metal-dependent peptidase
MSEHDDPVRRAIVGARIQLLLHKPFFGQMAMRLDLVDATKWCQTAATDGRRLYYNREFIKKLTPPELEFLVCHEILHCIYMHMTRRGNRDPKLYNMACDYIVNWTIKNENIGSMPKGGLWKSEYNDDLTSEELYEILLKNCVTVEMTMDEHLDYAGSNDDDDDEDGEKKRGKNGNQSGEDGDEDGEGGGSGGEDGEEDGEGKGKGKGNGKSKVRVYGEDGPPELTKEDIDKIKDSMIQALQETAQSVGAGNVPKGVQRLINKLTAPKMDWRELLDASIRSLIRDDYTYAQPNRRNYAGGFDDIIFAGQDFLNTIKIGIAIDTSGSMTDQMLQDFLSEVKGIMEEFRDFELWLWTFDTQCYGLKKFTGANLNDIFEYQMIGRGGTMFECNWEFMMNPPETDVDGESISGPIDVERFIMFTDGYPCGTWGEAYENFVDTLFVIHGSETIVAPFGMTAYYDDHRRKARKAA